MGISSFPFVSLDGDRKVLASQFRKYWKGFATNGIMKGLYNECQCSVNGLTVTIDTGIAHIQGALAILEDTEQVAITAVASARYATIVLEFNDNSDYRDIHVAVVYGTSSATATLTQTNEVWQLPLCSVFVSANATTLTAADIADLREYSFLRSVSNADKPIKNIKCITRTSDGIRLGDANEDGVLNDADITAISQYRVGIGSINIEAADLNGDGVVGNEDLINLRTLITNLPEGQIIARFVITYSDNTTDMIYGYVSDYAPIRGIDYWTDEDINEIKGYVDEAILGGAW